MPEPDSPARVSRQAPAAAAGAADARLVGEIAEGDAVGTVRDIYTGIRSTCSVPMVALIWRHLATLPGALEWAWALLEPALESGRIPRAAWAIAAGADVPPLARLPAAVLRVNGLDAAARAGIVGVLEAYNRANPVNIVALLCVARHLQRLEAGDTASAALPPGDTIAATTGTTAAAPSRLSDGVWVAPAPLPALPPMVAPHDMAPDVRALAALLSDRDPAMPSPILPSLWRHLAPWPPMLALSAVLVPPQFASIDAAAARVRARAEQAAAAIADELTTPPGGTARVAPFHAAVRQAIAGFAPRIPEMVVIGTMLRRAMPDADADADADATSPGASA